MILENNKKIAVALQYKKENNAPKIIAKGRGIVADKIIETGKDEGIKVYEDNRLAEDLISLNFDEEIPEELYTTVAKILVFIYELDREKGEKNEE